MDVVPLLRHFRRPPEREECEEPELRFGPIDTGLACVWAVALR